VLQKVPEIPMDSALQQRILGEARFLPGFVLFQPCPASLAMFLWLPSLFQSDLEEDEIYPVRTPQMISTVRSGEDLSLAASVVAPQYTNPGDKGRATKGAALGILSKVYLTNKDWTNAYQTASEVIGSNVYSLHADYTANFKEANKNGKESVFEVQFYKNSTAENSQMVISGLPSLPGVFSAGVEIMLPTDDLLNSFEEGDYRKQATFFDNYWAIPLNRIYGNTGIRWHTSLRTLASREPTLW
jgi:hypothetical protein